MEKNIVLESSAPIDDGGRKYNILYVIFAIIGFIVGFMIEMEVVLGIFAAIIGMIVAFAIKNTFATSKIMKMREYTFVCNNKISYDSLIQELQKNLMPLGFTIERHEGGYPVITYQKMRYDVTFVDGENTFNIWWSNSFGQSFFWGNVYTGRYRLASVAYGIIGYYVQQCCK